MRPSIISGIDLDLSPYKNFPFFLSFWNNLKTNSEKFWTLSQKAWWSLWDEGRWRWARILTFRSIPPETLSAGPQSSRSRAWFRRLSARGSVWSWEQPSYRGSSVLSSEYACLRIWHIAKNRYMSCRWSDSWSLDLSWWKKDRPERSGTLLFQSGTSEKK